MAEDSFHPHRTMIQPADAALLLVDTIKNERRHAWYQRTVDYADRMLKLITGEGADELLQQIVSRETPEQFTLRKKLFFPIVPAVCNRARVPFAKVPKADGLVDQITYTGEDQDGRRKRLAKAMDEFYGDESLSDYMNDRFLDLNRLDPNAFVIVDFSPFDHNRETAQPYPLEISSRQAINIGKTRNAVEWVIGQFDITYTVKGKPGEEIQKPGHRYVMYFGWIWDLHEVEFNKDASKELDPSQAEQVVNIGTRTFNVRLIDPFSDRQQKLREFQGIQVGHVKDLVTGGDTFVSSLHPGINRMMETLKSGSEFTLVMALQAHPEVFAYLPKCKGDVENGDMCDKHGKNLKGDNCVICKGTGRRFPNSVLDATILPFEDGMTDDDLVSLEKLKHFSAPDVAIIQFLWQFLRDIETRILTDIFTSVSVTDPVADGGQAAPETATKVAVDADAQNDAVYPYGLKWATVKMKLTRLCALFVDAEKGLVNPVKVPSDLKLQPLSMMVQNLTQAKGTVNPALYTIMEDDVVAKKLAERPLELQKYRVKQTFRPLEGQSEAVKKQALADGMVTQRDKVLLYNENEIYRNLDKVVGFWYMPQDDQLKLIAEQVDVILARLAEEKVKEIDFAPELREQQGVAA